MTAVFEDPDVGPIELRDVSRDEVLNLWSAVSGLDLMKALEVLPEDELRVDTDGWTTEDVCALIDVLSLASMAVVSPVPQRFEPDELPRPFPGGLIRPDDAWTHDVLQRIDAFVLERAGISDGPP